MKPIIITEENFASEVLGSSEPVLVDFWAEWCGPCRMLGPIIEEIAAASDGSYKVAKLNVDEAGAIAEKYGIVNIPTVIAFKNGEVAGKVVGVQSRENLMALVAD